METVRFERDNLRDPGNPDYIPQPPMNPTLVRSGSDMMIRWFAFSGGTDSVWIQKSIKGSEFETIARVAHTETEFKDTTRNLDYPSTYRLRSVFYSDSDIRVSEPSDVSLPEPIPGVPPGASVGVFTFSDNGFGGNIPNVSKLYDVRMRYVSAEYGLNEYVNYANFGVTTDGRTLLNFNAHHLFQTSHCPFFVEATFQLLLPSTVGGRLIQEHPINGSPFTIPYIAKGEQSNVGNVYKMEWDVLRFCPDCVVTAFRSSDSGASYTRIESVQQDVNFFEQTAPPGIYWYEMRLSCNGKQHPVILEYKFDS